MAEHGKEITDTAVRDMEYAEAVCKETLRLNPIVGSLFRKALRDFEVCGFRIRKVRAPLLWRPHSQAEQPPCCSICQWQRVSMAGHPLRLEAWAPLIYHEVGDP